MTTTRKTTYILLDRGYEDVDLLKEITQILENFDSPRTRATKYPLLVELKQNLKEETKCNEEC